MKYRVKKPIFAHNRYWQEGEVVSLPDERAEILKRYVEPVPEKPKGKKE